MSLEALVDLNDKLNTSLNLLSDSTLSFHNRAENTFNKIDKTVDKLDPEIDRLETLENHLDKIEKWLFILIIIVIAFISLVILYWIWEKVIYRYYKSRNNTNKK